MCATGKCYEWTILWVLYNVVGMADNYRKQESFNEILLFWTFSIEEGFDI